MAKGREWQRNGETPFVFRSPGVTGHVSPNVSSIKGLFFFDQSKNISLVEDFSNEIIYIPKCIYI